MDWLPIRLAIFLSRHPPLRATSYSSARRESALADRRFLSIIHRNFVKATMSNLRKHIYSEFAEIIIEYLTHSIE